MNKIMSVSELRANLRMVFDEVVKRHTAYILTRGGRPEAVLTPYDQFLKYEATAAASGVERFNQMLAQLAQANAAYSDAEVQADLAEVKTVRRAGKRK
jgi:prevent-host-death family protein